MGDINYGRDIAPLRRTFFDDSGMVAPMSSSERDNLRRAVAGSVVEQMDFDKQRVELQRQQNMLLEDTQRRRRQVEIDSKLGEATSALSEALKGKTTEQQALGVIDIQSKYAELAGYNPAFKVLLDAANRRLEYNSNKEYQAEQLAARTAYYQQRGTSAPKADPTKVRMWNADFDFVHGLAPKKAEGFGAEAGPAYAPEDITKMKRIARTYGIELDAFDEDIESAVYSLYVAITEAAPVGVSAESDGEAEPNPFDIYGE
jgi:hypothetical protein